MSDEKNILILSCGTRNKIVQYFRKELQGKGIVVATDCNKMAPALYEADKFYIVPRITEDGYLDEILNICRENKIKCVFSLIDPELSMLAANKNKFLELGVLPIISDLDAVEMAFDKYKMFEFLVQNGFDAIKSYIDKDAFFADVKNGLISYPVFVKPVKGSASNNINKVYSEAEIEYLFNKYDNLMIQEYMDGKEFGADVYIDMISNRPVEIFVKEKILLRAGETDKSVSYKDPHLFKLIKEFTKKSGYKGIIDIDLFKVGEKYYISEVNPRFGGGYPHAYECKVNIPKLIINNISNITNEETIGHYEEGIFMMKYNEIKII